MEEVRVVTDLRYKRFQTWNCICGNKLKVEVLDLTFDVDVGSFVGKFKVLNKEDHKDCDLSKLTMLSLEFDGVKREPIELSEEVE